MTLSGFLLGGIHRREKAISRNRTKTVIRVEAWRKIELSKRAEKSVEIQR